jgi:hypothetical protein
MNVTKSERWNIMKKKFIYSIFASLMVALMLYSTSLAHHPYAPGRHLISQHGSITDVWCADVKSSSVTLSSARTKINNVLTNSNGWRDGNEYNLTFMNAAYAEDNCSDISSSELEKVDIRYYIMTNTNTACGGYSCLQVRGGQTLTHTESDGTATDYQYAKIVIKESTFNGTAYDYIINHETGHAIGLIDGNGTCPGSIMHSADYGCSNGYPDWPTSNDKTSVGTESDEENYGDA